jgi:hypothetical protein
MDPDISIWQKTGHFYFALTRGVLVCHFKVRMSAFPPDRNVRVHGFPQGVADSFQCRDVGEQSSNRLWTTLWREVRA